MAQLELSVVTPERRVLPGPDEDRLLVDEIRAPGCDGSFGVRPGHTPFLTKTIPGELFYRRGEKTASYVVGSGFIEVERDRVSVLAEEIISADKIDVEQARQALMASEAKLKGMGTNDPAYADELARALWARAQIAVAAPKRA